MRGLVVGTLGAVALMLSSPVQAQSTIGVWTVELGKKCAITQMWKGDTKNDLGIMISYLAKGQALLLAFYDTDTTFKDKEEFKVTLEVDKKWKAKVDGFGADKNTAGVVLPASSDAVNALMNGNSLYMEVADKPDNYSGTYSLDDTRKAIAALDSCRAQAD
ncbi:hypothetical protein [Azospirillum sp. sgz301742]